MMNVSVCMATYNGARFIEEQLRSIVSQIGPHDEIVVVDDGSRDGTVEFLQSFADARLRLYSNARNVGPTQSFDRAMSLATNEVLVLADQDDLWVAGRLSLMLGAMERERALLVSANSRYMDADGRPIGFSARRLRREDSRRCWRNIVAIFAGRAPYYGCTMALDRRLLTIVSPMPGYVESHDLWIAMAANLVAANVHLDDEVLVRRIHGGNASVVRRDVLSKLRSRLIFAASLVVLTARALTPRWRASGLVSRRTA